MTHNQHILDFTLHATLEHPLMIACAIFSVASAFLILYVALGAKISADDVRLSEPRAE